MTLIYGLYCASFHALRCIKNLLGDIADNLIDACFFIFFLFQTWFNIFAIDLTLLTHDVDVILFNFHCMINTQLTLCVITILIEWHNQIIIKWKSFSVSLQFCQNVIGNFDRKYQWSKIVICVKVTQMKKEKKGIYHFVLKLLEALFVLFNINELNLLTIRFQNGLPYYLIKLSFLY